MIELPDASKLTFLHLIVLTNGLFPDHTSHKSPIALFKSHMALPLPVSYKIVILGTSGVGKSSIVHRLLGGTFLRDGGPTCGADFHSHTLQANGETAKLQIWDTAGQERFRAISKAYFRSAVGGILVFDLTNPESFEDLTGWLHDLETLASPNACIIVAANKKDLVSERKVGAAEVKLFADRHHLEVIETSAASGENIEVAFQRLTQEVLVRVKDGRIEIPQLALTQGPVEIPKTAKKKGCC
jgi:small GTP-binding protein